MVKTHNQISRVLLLFFLALLSLMVYLFAVSNNHYTSGSSTATTIELTTETLTANEARIIEVVSGHAWQNHGDEVNSAIKCLSNNGTWKSFRTSGFTDDNNRHVDANLWICFDGNEYSAAVP